MLGFRIFSRIFPKNFKFGSYPNGLKPCHFFTYFDFLEIFMKSCSSQIWGFLNFFANILKILFSQFTQIVWNHVIFSLILFFFEFYEIFMKSCSSQIWGFLNFCIDFQKNLSFSNYSNGLKTCHFFTYFDFFEVFRYIWWKFGVVKCRDFWTFFLISEGFLLKNATDNRFWL